MALKRTGRFGAIWLSFSLDCTMATTISLTGPLQMDITQQLEQLRQIWTAPWNARSDDGRSKSSGFYEIEGCNSVRKLIWSYGDVQLPFSLLHTIQICLLTSTLLESGRNSLSFENKSLKNVKQLCSCVCWRMPVIRISRLWTHISRHP